VPRSRLPKTAALASGSAAERPLPVVKAAVTSDLAWRRLSLFVQLSAFVLVLGIPDGSLGVLWPSMRETFRLPLDDLGLLTIASTGLYVGGGLGGTFIRARLGVAGAMTASISLAIASLAAWAFGPWWALVLVGVALLGLSRGVIDSVLNADAALAGGVRRLGLLHGSWAIGGTLGPILVAIVLASSHDWRVAVAITAGALVVLLPVAVVAERRPGAAADTGAPGAGSAGSAGGAGEAGAGAAGEEAALRANVQLGAGPADSPSSGEVPPPHDPQHGSKAPFVLTVLAFIAYTGAESGPIAWGYTYLLSDKHVSHTAGALAMAVFWAALTAGRFGLAWIGHRYSAVAILEMSCGLLAAGTAMFWLLPGGLAILGLLVAGAGSAPVFPMLMALTPERIGTRLTGHAVGASIAAAGLGGPLAVAAFGVLAAHLGVATLGACLFGASVLLLFVNRILTIVTRRLAT
jgi:fucose permease